MKKLMIVSLMGLTSSVALAQAGNGVFERIQANCSSVKECACQEICNDVCRIVNGEQVCDESCKTVCEYSTSGGKADSPISTQGNGSEACVTHCGDAADDACGEDASCRSSFFRGCMMTCWM
ncbi:MAG: hypothetical protein NDJ90_06110 [Oligoflexia bacterium]|nr:hypothetical protein [Oligoflexia bacterium]